MTAVDDLKRNTVLLAALSKNLPNTYIAIYNRNLILEFITGPQTNNYPFKLNPKTGLALSQIFSDYKSTILKKVTDKYQKAFLGKHIQFNITNNDEYEHHSISPITGDKDHIEYILCFVQNTTEQKQSTATLKQSEARLKMATQLAKIGYWELNLDTSMFTFSDQFLDILKVTTEDLGGHSIPIQRYANDFLLPEDITMLQHEIELAKETRDPNFSRYIEHPFIDGTGNTGYLAARYIAVKDKKGRTIKTIGANQDITEIKIAEKALKELLDKTTNQNSRLRDFSFMTSHNIRSSVANLVGLSQMLKEEPGNLHYIEMLNTTVIELDKTVKNINSLLNFESAAETEIKMECNLQEALNRFIELNTKHIEQMEIEIVSLLPAGLSVYYVPAYIDSIFHNLINNAIKYGTNDLSKKIEIGQKSANPITFYVKDFGIGIDLKKYGAKLFDLGSRFHSNKDGQGLGLYMTKHQIESAGGTIEVESTINGGTTFTVVLGTI